ncbi:putative SP-containing protein [Vairimorpha necatrix]|uniref:SP-containing protein n=1 Tax=Vairimorpha necatrix TaxID=6039 RepID=A0AAX4J8W6_9MICR
MLYFYISTLFKILLAESKTYTAFLTIDNLEYNCIVSSEFDDTTFSINKFSKLVLNFMIDDKSGVYINLDDKFVKIRDIKYTCSIDGYDFNGKLLSSLRLFDKKELIIIFQGSHNASFEYHCTNQISCLSSLNCKFGKMNLMGNDNFNFDYIITNLFFEQSPRSITSIFRQNGNYILTNSNCKSTNKCFYRDHRYSMHKNLRMFKTNIIKFTTTKNLKISFLNVDNHE